MESNSPNPTTYTFEDGAARQQLYGHRALPVVPADGAQAYQSPFRQVSPLRDINTFQALMDNPDRNNGLGAGPQELPQGQEPPPPGATSVPAGHAPGAVETPIPNSMMSGSGKASPAAIDDGPSIPNGSSHGVATPNANSSHTPPGTPTPAEIVPRGAPMTPQIHTNTEVFEIGSTFGSTARTPR